MTPGNSFFSLIRAVGTRRGPGLGGTDPPQVLVEIEAAAPCLFHLLICSNSIVYSQFATRRVAQMAPQMICSVATSCISKDIGTKAAFFF